MHIIDLRSDTVTHPTDEMRDAARNAVVGDDVFADDPTVNELEAYAAELVGKEAALFVSSGTQGNIVSLLAQTTHGDEILLDSQSHIYHYEVGGLAALAGVIPKLFESHQGVIRQSEISALLRPKNIHFAPTTLLALENTHNRYGGIAISVADFAVPAKEAHEYDIKVHLDGARIFNAVVAHNEDVKNYTKYVDSVQFCLSKGLSAPIGSIVAGTEEFVEKARKKRKMLGGGMRQVGIIAAPALVALKKMRTRLKEDHTTAKLLAKRLREQGFQAVEPQTNIVVVDITSKYTNSEQAVAAFQKKNIATVPFGSNLVRFTTHRHITSADIEEVATRISGL